MRIGSETIIFNFNRADKRGHEKSFVILRPKCVENEIITTRGQIFRFLSDDCNCTMHGMHGATQAQTDNDDTLALLDCLGEGAAAEEGGPLREVCAKGVVEFLRYAIKQTSKRQQVRAIRGGRG